MHAAGQCYRIIPPVKAYIIRAGKPWDSPESYECELWGGENAVPFIRMFSTHALIFGATTPVGAGADAPPPYHSQQEWAAAGYTCLRYGTRQMLIPHDHIELVPYVFARIHRDPEDASLWRAELESEPEKYAARLRYQEAELALQSMYPDVHLIFHYDG